MRHVLLRRVFLPILGGLILLPAVARAANKAAANNAAAKKEAVNRLKNDLKYLASDELEGRGVGTKGLGKAAEYVKKQFKAAGLNVSTIKGDAYFTFELPTGSKLGKTNEISFVGKDGKKITLKYGKDFRTCSFGRSGKFDADVVFVGFGIHAPRLKYSDYEGVDLKGKVAIIMRRLPGQGNRRSKFRGLAGRRYQGLQHKYGEAFKRGAAAVLFVNSPTYVAAENKRRESLVATAKENVVKAAEELHEMEKSKTADTLKKGAAQRKLFLAVSRLKAARKAAEGDVDELMSFGYGGNVYRGKQPRPIFHITIPACDRLLKASLKKSLADLENEINKNVAPKSIQLAGGWKAKGEASLSLQTETVKNVVGVLEGEGPLADETIVVGAHYDHVGMGRYGSLAGAKNTVHNGADDNASGTVALIELARRLGARKKKLPRRIVFIAFTAEELGLIGSKRYVEKPTYPLKNTIAMFNMDMVGRLRDGKMTVFCVGSSPRWEPLVKRHFDSPFKLTLRKDIFPRSDHAPFAQKKVPAIHFFTNTHSDYHRPSDDWPKVNFEGMEEIVGRVEQAVIETAETKERPKFTQPPSPPRRKRSSQTWSYFGARPDLRARVQGVKITSTTKGSAAQKAGIKAGDVIVKIGTSNINGLRDYVTALGRQKTGAAFEIVVKRNGKDVKLKATLEKPR